MFSLVGQAERRNMMNENLDVTINNICKWIDSNLNQTSTMDETQTMPNMIIALAELVSARAKQF